MNALKFNEYVNEKKKEKDDEKDDETSELIAKLKKLSPEKLEIVLSKIGKKSEKEDGKDNEGGGSKKGLTKKQLKLPPALQAAILKRQKK